MLPAHEMDDMLTESRSTFMLVRNDACLTRANEDLGVYQSFLRRRVPASGLDTVQGIWVDEEDVANLPDALVLPDESGARRTVRIEEAAGINGLWMLCWLEAAARTVSRDDLVDALLACFRADDVTTVRARFIPVFADDMPDARVIAEMHVLESRFPGLVLPPLFQDASGSLALASASSPSQESAS